MLPRAWAIVRTVFVVAGLAFAIMELAAACLDHVGEELNRCDKGAPDTGADCGPGAAPPPATGSGSGSK